MKTVHAKLIGRLGNRMFIWAHAKAFCEQNGYELHTEEWVGEHIFTLDNWIPRPVTGTEDIVIDGYCQNQESLIYSRADCRRWFELKRGVKAELEAFQFPQSTYVHLRRGDYKSSSGYPLVSLSSAVRAMNEFGLGCEYRTASDDSPLELSTFTGELSFLPDFYRLMKAPILFRSNSSFSFWAGVLSHGRIFSPIITGLAGGVEHDNVPFVEGNHPRLCELDFVTDLHLREQ